MNKHDKLAKGLFYPLAEQVSLPDLQALNIRAVDARGTYNPLIKHPEYPTLKTVVLRDGTRLTIKAVWTGKKRIPRKGEWFLSGSTVEAYRCNPPKDAAYTSPYPIARLVLVKTVEVTLELPAIPQEKPFGCLCTSVSHHILGDGCAICNPEKAAELGVPENEEGT